MHTKKILSIALSTLLLTQTSASAAMNRSAGITDNAIFQARQNLLKVAVDLENLDLALKQTEEAIMSRQQNDSIFNISGAGLAFVSVAATIAAVAITMSPYSSKLIPNYLMYGGSLTALANGIAGVTSYLKRENINIDEVNLKLLQAQEKLQQEIPRAGNASLTLINMNQEVSKIIESLNAYHNKQNASETEELISSLLQSSSALAAIIGAGRGNVLFAISGAAGTVAGSLAKVISKMTKEQADSILREIHLTRITLNSTIHSLKN